MPFQSCTTLSQGSQTFVPHPQSGANQLPVTGCPWGEGVTLGKERDSNTPQPAPPAGEDLGIDV